MSTDAWLMGGFVAGAVAFMALGWLMRGWADAERRRSVTPEHPAVLFGVNRTGPPQPPRWRVIEGGLQRPPKLFDWQHDEGRNV